MSELKIEPERGVADTIAMTEATATVKTPCPRCRELIFSGATICINCKSDLTWRRHLSVSSATLASITALIAVAATLGPQIKSLFAPQDSAITAVMVGQAPLRGAVSMLISNNGTRSGAVSTAVVSVPYYGDKGVEEMEPFRLIVKGDEMEFLQPNTTRQVAFQWIERDRPGGQPEHARFARQIKNDSEKELEFMRALFRSEKARCKLSVLVANASGSTVIHDSMFACSKVATHVQGSINDERVWSSAR
jgi:hypothetical protein